ncbi:MAG: hypothetical protein ACPGQS_09875, partial [Bradymonadia bacterium]
MNARYTAIAFILISLLVQACVVEDDANADGDNTTGTEDMMPATEADATVEVDSTLEEVDAMMDGGECVVDGDCGSFLRVCRNGLCLNRCFGGTCFQGGVCMDGACFPPECEADDQCAEDEICREESCIPKVDCETTADCDE